jgi:MFS family permease
LVASVDGGTDSGRDEAARLGPRFARLWAASTTSALGSGLATIAAPLYVASRTHSPLIVSGATGVAWLPWLLFALPGGVLVDRVDRRRLMVAIDWTRVAAMLVLATAILTRHGSLALLYAVVFPTSRSSLTRAPMWPAPSSSLWSPARTGQHRTRRRAPVAAATRRAFCGRSGRRSPKGSAG